MLESLFNKVAGLKVESLFNKVAGLKLDFHSATAAFPDRSPNGQLSLNDVKRMRMKEKIKVSSLISATKRSWPKVEKKRTFCSITKAL